MSIYISDFETTTYKGQTKTEVWAACIESVDSVVSLIFNSLDSYMSHLLNLAMCDDINIYFHNAKYDCSYILTWFLQKNVKQAVVLDNDGNITGMLGKKKMKPNTITYLISDKGLFYKLTYKTQSGHYIQFYDSYKILPFSVKEIGESFGTTVQKGKIDYTKHKKSGEFITAEEKEYIRNDVKIVKEALKEMFHRGYTKITIGSNCLNEFKKDYGFYPGQYKIDFPDLTQEDLTKYGYKNMFDYIYKAYYGAWCYLVDGKERKYFYNGITLDVNSLYPSVMHSVSGNYYPVGKGKYVKGAPCEKIKNPHRYYYFIHFRCRFKIKDGYLPFIQVKNSYNYRANEMLKTSDVYSYKDKKYYSCYYDKEGNIKKYDVEFYMTCTDWERFNEFYDIYDLDIIDHIYFNADIGIFDKYVNKYRDLKINAKNKTERQIAKLFLNNLYGKLATNDNSSFKYCYLDDSGVLKFKNIEEHKKHVGYIPCGSAITSYARDFIIRCAQANYYGPYNPGFIYADTDSLHMDIPLESLKNCELDDKEFLKFKCEVCWDKAFFVRQKTYIEHCVKKDMRDCKPYYNIVCAGLPKESKDILRNNLEGKVYLNKDIEPDIKKFMQKKREMKDFIPGIEIPGKLQQKYIPGGIVLVNTDFNLKENAWRL